MVAVLTAHAFTLDFAQDDCHAFLLYNQLTIQEMSSSSFTRMKKAFDPAGGCGGLSRKPTVLAENSLQSWTGVD